MKTIFTLLLLFVVSLGFSQVLQDESFLYDGFTQKDPDGILATPTTIEQRLINFSIFHSYDESYDSTQYFYAEANDANYNIKTTYRKLGNDAFIYYKTDTLEFDSEDREVASRLYFWQEDITKFVPTSRRSVTYDGLNTFTFKESYDDENGIWKNATKEYKEVFINGERKEESKFFWDETLQEWVLRDYYLGNENGDYLETIYRFYDGTIKKKLAERDSDGKILKATELFFDTISQSFVNYTKREYHWASDTLRNEYIYNWSGMDWILDYKSIVLFNNNDKLKRILVLDSIGIGQYENSRLIEWEYTAFDELSSYKRSEWNKDSGTPFWESRREVVWQYDSNNHLMKRVSSYWVEDSMKVVPKFLYNYIYDDNNNITFKKSEAWDFDTKEWVLKVRYNWRYEDYENGLMSIQNLEQVALNVYPNPSSDYIVFDIKDAAKAFTVYFYSANGAALFSKEVSSNQQVNVSRLASGVYYYIIKGDGVGASGQFVKE